MMKSHKLIQLCFPIELLLPIGAQVAKKPLLICTVPSRTRYLAGPPCLDQPVFKIISRSGCK